MDYKSFELEKLTSNAYRSRLLTFLLAHTNGDGHLSSSMSCLEILSVVQNEVMKESAGLILSKGHAALGYYCILNSFGIIELKELLQYNQDESRLTSHPDRNLFNSVMLSSGSLGMGLGFGCGLALAKKLAGESGRYFVLMGDGECNEGSVWESAWFASVNRLNNLVAIIDQNNIQAVATAEDFISGGTIADKFKAFGWSVHECAGHDISEIHKAISQKSMSPIAVIAHTSGSKSFVYEQNSVMWHYRRPTREEVTQFFEFHSAETKAPDIVRLLS